MRPKSMVLIMIALGCGLVASIGISQVMESRTGQAPAEATQEIYVAMTDIPVGSPITPQLVKLEKWPKERVPTGAVTDIKDIEGKMPKTPLFSGEPIMVAKLSDSLGGTGERIPKGYRVMSVKVSTDTGVSGLILPGDRVDILVFLKRNGEIQSTGTRTILKDVCIFAVDGKINRETDTDGNVENVKTVSVLVKPDQVEKLMLADQLGRLSLSLRRADDDMEDETGGAAVSALNESEQSERLGQPQTPANPTNETAPDGGLLSFINKIRNNATPPVDSMAEATTDRPPAFTMQIHTPDGVEVVNWDDKKALPRGVTPADTGNAMPAEATTGTGATTPAPDPVAEPTTPTKQADVPTSPPPGTHVDPLDPLEVEPAPATTRPAAKTS